MAAVLDSSVLIAAERGKLDQDQRLRSYPEDPVAIAAITASELLHGVHRAADPLQRARREAFVERFLGGLTVLPFDLVVARVHARLAAELGAKGDPVGAHGLMIAATAMAVGYCLATRDDRSSPKIPGVSLLSW